MKNIFFLLRSLFLFLIVTFLLLTAESNSLPPTEHSTEKSIYFHFSSYYWAESSSKMDLKENPAVWRADNVHSLRKQKIVFLLFTFQQLDGQGRGSILNRLVCELLAAAHPYLIMMFTVRTREKRFARGPRSFHFLLSAGPIHSLMRTRQSFDVFGRIYFNLNENYDSIMAICFM